jgi:hypothetical protein
VSYFFWASALPLVAAKAMTAVENAAIRSFCRASIMFPQGGIFEVLFVILCGESVKRTSDTNPRWMSSSLRGALATKQSSLALWPWIASLRSQ